MSQSETKNNKLADSVVLTILTKLITVIGMPVLVGFLYWQSSTILDSKNTITSLSISVTNLDKKVDEISENMYTTRDAEKDFALRDNKINDLDKRTTILENRVIYNK